MNVFGRSRKGKKRQVFRCVDNKGDVDVTWMVSPVTGNLFFTGIYLLDHNGGLRIPFSGFANKGHHRQAYAGNLITFDGDVPHRRQLVVLYTIMSGARWNGFTRAYCKELFR